VKGPVSVIADVGVGNIFQRATCCPPAILGGYLSGETADGKYAKRVTAPQRRRPHDCHAHSQINKKPPTGSTLRRRSRKFYRAI